MQAFLILTTLLAFETLIFNVRGQNLTEKIGLDKFYLYQTFRIKNTRDGLNSSFPSLYLKHIIKQLFHLHQY